MNERAAPEELSCRVRTPADLGFWLCFGCGSVRVSACRNDAISTGAFGGVQSAIGDCHERLGSLLVGFRETSRAQADGYAEYAFVGGDFQGANRFAQAFPGAVRPREIDTAQ